MVDKAAPRREHEAHLRPNCHLKAGVKIGNFVEIKNSTLGEGSKSAHLTYIGDADVGEKVNFGCGVVVVNYDGMDKHRTTVEDEAFVGCNANLVAPVTLGKKTFIAAGTTVTKNVPEDTLEVFQQAGTPRRLGLATRSPAQEETRLETPRHQRAGHWVASAGEELCAESWATSAVRRTPRRS